MDWRHELESSTPSEHFFVFLLLSSSSSICYAIFILIGCDWEQCDVLAQFLMDISGVLSSNMASRLLHLASIIRNDMELELLQEAV